MTIGERNQFSFQELGSSLATASAMNKLGPAEETLMNDSNASQLATKLLVNTTQVGLQSALESETGGPSFSLEVIAVNALGASLGQQSAQMIGNTSEFAEIKQEVNALKSNVSATSIGRNTNSFFNRGNSQNNSNSNLQTQNTSNANNSNINSGNNSNTNQNSDQNKNTDYYGSGNAKATGKLSADAQQLANAQAWANAPLNILAPDPNLLGNQATNSSQSLLSTINAFANNAVVATTSGFINGFGDTLTNVLAHPLNAIENVGNLVFDVGEVAFGADYTGEARAQLMNVGKGLVNLFNGTESNNPYDRGYAWGTITFAGVSGPIGGEIIPVVGEMGEITAARALFSPSINPEAAMARQYAMLQQNIGYNVSPSSWFSLYPGIGSSGETFLTDYPSISSALGDIEPNQSYNVGLISHGNQISFFKTTTLGLQLGLSNPYQLNDGFVFSEVSGINEMMPRSPLVGNQFFLGPGMGLQNEGPELVVEQLQTNSWPWKNGI